MVGTVIFVVIVALVMSAISVGVFHRIKLSKALNKEIAQKKDHEATRYARQEVMKTKQLNRESYQELTSQIVKKTVNVLMTDEQVREKMMSAPSEKARISLVLPLFFRALEGHDELLEHKKTHGTNELARQVITYFFNIKVHAARKEINVSDQLSSFSLHSSMSIDDALTLGKKNAQDALAQRQRQHTARQEHKKRVRQERVAAEAEAEARRVQEHRRVVDLRNRAQKLWTGMTPAQQQQVISGVDDRAKVAALTVYAGSRDTARNMLPMLKGIDSRLLSGSGFTPSAAAVRKGISKGSTTSSSRSSSKASSSTTSSYSSSRSSSGSDDIVRTATTVAALSFISDDLSRSSFGGGYSSGGPDVSFGGGYDGGSFSGGGGSGDW